MLAEIVFWSALSIIVYTYAVYPLILFLMLQFRRQTVRDADDNGSSLVSMVISAYNEESSLPEKIANMRKTRYPEEKIEFLIGSDGSTDATNEILRKSEGGNVRSFVFDRRAGKASVLNKLVPHARGEIIVFSDANTLYREDTIANLVRRFADPKVGAVCGELILTTDSAVAGGVGESSYWAYETVLKQLESQIRTIIGATGGVYAIRKDLYCGLPVDRPVADDLYLPLQIVIRGYDVKYEPLAKAFEQSTDSINMEFRRKVRIGAQSLSTISRVRRLLDPRRGFVSFALWSHKIIRWFVPCLMIVIFLASIFLVSSSLLYTMFFLLECILVLVACVGWISEKFRIRIGMLVIPYYFLAMNAALLVGLLKGAFRQQGLIWETVR